MRRYKGIGEYLRTGGRSYKPFGSGSSKASERTSNSGPSIAASVRREMREQERAQKKAEYEARKAERERKKQDYEARKAQRARDNALKQAEYEERKRRREAEKARKQAEWEARQAERERRKQEREAERARKQAEYEAERARRSEAHAAKSALIEQAKSLASSQDWRTTHGKMKALNAAWQGAGWTGPGERDLKKEFRAVQQSFYDAWTASNKASASRTNSAKPRTNKGPPKKVVREVERENLRATVSATGRVPNLAPEKWGKDDGRKEGHHSHPKYLGGDPNQPLTNLASKGQGGHRHLHSDADTFLDVKRKAGANGQPTSASMRAGRGNPGERIQREFTAEQRAEAMGAFYENHADRHGKAGKDFSQQNPETKGASERATNRLTGFLRSFGKRKSQ